MNVKGNLRGCVVTAVITLLCVAIPALAVAADRQAELAQLTPQQVQACAAERQQLTQQLGQCTTNECRQRLQAAIDEHNRRCSR